MKETQWLKIQAYLDGELAAAEVKEVEAWLAQDAEARSMLEELKGTVGALKQADTIVPVPCSGDFYWSQIQRQIEGVEQSAHENSRVSWLPSWWKMLLPASAVGLLAVLLSLNPGHERAISTAYYIEVETAYPDASVMTYRSESEGVSVVWINTP